MWSEVRGLWYCFFLQISEETPYDITDLVFYPQSDRSGHPIPTGATYYKPTQQPFSKEKQIAELRKPPDLKDSSHRRKSCCLGCLHCFLCFEYSHTGSQSVPVTEDINHSAIPPENRSVLFCGVCWAGPCLFFCSLELLTSFQAAKTTLRWLLLSLHAQEMSVGLASTSSSLHTPIPNCAFNIPEPLTSFSLSTLWVTFSIKLKRLHFQSATLEGLCLSLISLQIPT